MSALEDYVVFNDKSLYWPVTEGHASGPWLGAFASAQMRMGARWWLAPEVRGEVSREIPVTGFAMHIGIGVGVGVDI